MRENIERVINMSQDLRQVGEVEAANRLIFYLLELLYIKRHRIGSKSPARLGKVMVIRTVDDFLYWNGTKEGHAFWKRIQKIQDPGWGF